MTGILSSINWQVSVMYSSIYATLIFFLSVFTLMLYKDVLKLQMEVMSTLDGEEEHRQW